MWQLAGPVGDLAAGLPKGTDVPLNDAGKKVMASGASNLKRITLELGGNDAAIVLADVETALQLDKAIAFRATAHVSDFLPMSKRDILKFEGCAEAWKRALSDAGIALGDLSLVETHDCFTVAELIEYEAMGLVPEGQGFRAIKEGWTHKDGKLPVVLFCAGGVATPADAALVMQLGAEGVFVGSGIFKSGAEFEDGTADGRAKQRAAQAKMAAAGSPADFLGVEAMTARWEKYEGDLKPVMADLLAEDKK